MWDLSSGDPFTVAVIGCGTAGGGHAAAAQMHPRARIVACWDVDSARCDAFAREHGIAAVSSLQRLVTLDVDVACVATGPAVQPSVVHELMHLGFRGSILAEKPLALSVGAARELVRDSESLGILLAVNLQRWFSTPAVMTERMVSGGGLGPISDMTFRGLGGTLLDWGPHWAHASGHLSIGRPTWVEYESGDRDSPAMHAGLVLESDVTVSWGSDTGVVCTMRTQGQPGSPLAVIRGERHLLQLGSMDRRGDAWVPGAPLRLCELDGTVVQEWRDIERVLHPQQWVRSLHLVATHTSVDPPPHAARTCMGSVEVVVAAFLSRDADRRVPLPIDEGFAVSGI